MKFDILLLMKTPLTKPPNNVQVTATTALDGSHPKSPVLHDHKSR